MPNNPMTGAGTPAPNQDGLSTWDEVRRLADTLELKTHLATMEARDRWREIVPRLEALEKAIAKSGERAGQAVMDELRAVRALLEKLNEQSS